MKSKISKNTLKAKNTSVPSEKLDFLLKNSCKIEETSKYRTQKRMVEEGTQ